MRFTFVLALLVATAGTARAIRPTDGDGWFGNGYDPGVPVRSFDSASGHFRVWFVESSVDAVQPGDADANGVPDFVELVAQHADEVWASTVDDRGFRPPLDDSVYHDTSDFGGDGRYDIYLENISDSDGYRVTEVCTGVPYHCSGYFVMENDFAGFGYPSDEMGIKVLTSHELFHALQDAYDADQDRKWTEGTAVWNEEQVFPEQDDFEGFLRFFLDVPERPFDRTGGSIADLYPYGAAIWPVFLTERFGPDVVRQIWEACEDPDGSNPDFMEATDAVLRAQYSSTFLDAFVEFTQWNLFTAERADPSRAYAEGASWPGVRLETTVTGYPVSTVVRSEGMSARYVPIQLEDRGGTTARLTVSVESRPVRATAFLWDGTTLGDGVELSGSNANVLSMDLSWQGGPTLIVLITGTIKGALPHDVTITLDDAPPPPDAGPSEEGDSGGCGCHAASRRGATPWLPSLLLALIPLALLLTARRSRGAR